MRADVIDMKRQRYSGLVVRRAREHHAAGWSLNRIRTLLSSEFEIAPPSLETVKRWVDPMYAEHVRRQVLARNARRYLRACPPKPRPLSTYRADAILVELRSRGLPWYAIVQVAELWWGERLTVRSAKERVAAAASGAVA